MLVGTSIPLFVLCTRKIIYLSQHLSMYSHLKQCSAGLMLVIKFNDRSVVSFIWLASNVEVAKEGNLAC